MNDDVIKLREALYAAEPFLTYLMTERDVPRNNSFLLDALNKVRGVLDMDPYKPRPSREYDATKLFDERIVISDYVENEDGSVSLKLDIGEDAAKALIHMGFSALLKDMSEKDK